MHRKFPIQLIYTALLGVSLSFVGCSSTQTPLETESTSAKPLEDTAQVLTHPLAQDQAINGSDNPIGADYADPWQLVEASATKPPAESSALLLYASELFLNQQHYSTAYSMLDEIDSSWLNADQKLFFALIHARYSLLTGDTDRAQSLLARIPKHSSMSRENQIRFLQLDIAIAAQQTDFKRALQSRLELDPILDEQSRLANQQRILSTLTRDSQLLANVNAGSLDPVRQGWLALAELNRQNGLDENELSRWQQQYPGHPALVQALLVSSAGKQVSSEHIALLLPITSRLGHAAQAFKAGFDAAIAQTGQYNRSRVYDIGNEPELVGFYYQGAINDGSDFIIGPLGRTGAQSLLDHLSQAGKQPASTLLLGELNNEHSLIPNIWGLSLSPEQDATAIAERAISQGLHRALVLQKGNDWGQRQGEAFTRAFLAKGGTIVSSQKFQPQSGDHSAAIKQLLDINSSDLRHQRLEDLLGTRLKFSVNRRNDVDFVFLAGNARDAQQIVPLAKFYRAHDLPIYASSSAFNGKFNKLTDEDLEGLRFAALPWLLNKQIELQEQEKARHSEEEAARAQAEAIARGEIQATPPVPEPIEEDEQETTEPIALLPYSNATLNRLYALGFSAFESISQLGYLQSDEWYRFQTQTMSLNMDESRNLRHEVAWGQYAADGIRRIR